MHQFFKNNKYLLFILLFMTIHYWIYVSRIPTKYYSDSYIYLKLAENLASEHSYHLPGSTATIYSFYPPGYSLTITGLQGLTHMPYKNAVTWIAYLSLMIFLIYFYKITGFYFRDNKWRMTLLILVCFSAIYPFFFIALSEHVFLALLMIQMYLLLKWERDKNYKYLFFAGIFMGLLLLTRYASFGLLFSESMWLVWIFYKQKLKGKQILYFLFPPTLFFSIWFFLISIHNSGSMGRKIIFHPPDLAHFKELIKSLFNWIVPGLTPYFFIPVILLFILLIWNSRKYIHSLIGKPDIQLWLFNLLGYLIFLSGVISFLDFSSSYDFRLLLPAYFSFIIIFSLLLYQNIRVIKSKIAYALSGLVVLSFLLHFIQFNLYSSPKIYSPELIRLLKNNEKYVYTNTTDLLPELMKNDSLIRQIPFTYNPKSTLSNPNFNKSMQNMLDSVRHNQAVIIYFDGYEDWDFCPSKDEILKNFKQIKKVDFSEGSYIKAIE